MMTISQAGVSASGKGIDMTDLNRITVVLPSLDPDAKLLTVIDGLLEYGFTDIVLVNDGSNPENMHYFEEAAGHPEVHLLHHEINRGKGAALKTAFRWVLENRTDSLGVVTVDGDNQHHPEDTRACSLHMAETDRIVLGVRDFDQPDVPFKSRNGNKITSLVFKIFVGMAISDTQTGLRAIPGKYLPLLCDISGERFEYETNMLLEMKRRNIPFDEVKIRTVYIEENKSSHFHAVRDSWRIYKLILRHFFLYGISSLLSAIVDAGLFALLTMVLSGVLTGSLLTFVPTAVARIISSIMNFFMNKKMVFGSRMSTGKTMTRYFMLAVPQAIVQMLLTDGLIFLLRITPEQTFLRFLIYGFVMCFLFIFSFLIQQRWVFADKNESNS
jgi:glycosyltransferase involved in cell wall biosynthesis